MLIPSIDLQGGRIVQERREDEPREEQHRQTQNSKQDRGDLDHVPAPAFGVGRVAGPEGLTHQ